MTNLHACSDACPCHTLRAEPLDAGNHDDASTLDAPRAERRLDYFDYFPLVGSERPHLTGVPAVNTGRAADSSSASPSPTSGATVSEQPDGWVVHYRGELVAGGLSETGARAYVAALNALAEIAA